MGCRALTKKKRLIYAQKILNIGKIGSNIFYMHSFIAQKYAYDVNVHNAYNRFTHRNKLNVLCFKHKQLTQNHLKNTYDVLIY